MDGLAFIAAIVALFVAFGMRRRVTALQTQLDSLTDELRSLRTAVAFTRPSPERPSASEPETAPADESPEVREQPEPAANEPAPQAAPAEQPAPPVSAAPGTTLEERLGTRWAVWVGGLALALGGVLLVRYSIEQGIFGPGVRVALGALFALALVAAGEWFRRSERAHAHRGRSCGSHPEHPDGCGHRQRLRHRLRRACAVPVHRPGYSLRHARRHRHRHDACRCPAWAGACRSRARGLIRRAFAHRVPATQPLAPRHLSRRRRRRRLCACPSAPMAMARRCDGRRRGDLGFRAERQRGPGRRSPLVGGALRSRRHPASARRRLHGDRAASGRFRRCRGA